MNLVTINAREITNTNIIVGPTNTLARSLSAAQIYLTYADSDVQALYAFKHRHERHQYLTALDLTVRLLLLFKPLHRSILVSPSSLIQSDLSAAAILPFLNCDEIQGAHFLLPLREGHWKDYFEKRRNNMAPLRKIHPYSKYYERAVEKSMESLPTSRKKYFSGSSTIEKWCERVSQTIGIYRCQPKNLRETARETLNQQAFVQESALDSLTRVGLQIDPWDARALLVDSYLESVGQDCAVPTGIPLAWDPAPASATQLSYPIRWLHQFARDHGILRRALETPPERFHVLINSPEILSLREKFHRSLDVK